MPHAVTRMSLLAYSRQRSTILQKERCHEGQCRRLNLASFVTTWMEPECDELVSEARNINYIDEVRQASLLS